MINKIKNIIKYIETQLDTVTRQNQQVISLQRESVWAEVYHDTIRSYKPLQELSLSPGRMAANYSLLYLLTRILLHVKPESILEFGLGESSKLIATHLTHYLKSTNHVIIEHEREWINFFEREFSLSERSKIKHFDTDTLFKHGHKINIYRGLPHEELKDYFLYIVDGKSSPNYSRYDICLLAEKGLAQDFIIILDDYDRRSEKETGLQLLKVLQEQGRSIVYGEYHGTKHQLLITTPKYRFLTSL